MQDPVNLNEIEAFCLSAVQLVLSSFPYFQPIQKHSKYHFLLAKISSRVYQDLQQQLPSISNCHPLQRIKDILKQSLPLHVCTEMVSGNMYAEEHLFVPLIIHSSKEEVPNCLTGNVGSASEKGRRESNEDRHVFIPYFNQIFSLNVSF
jgi:hypothetical protein